MKRKYRSGEIYSFPFSEGKETGFLRVVLAIGDLRIQQNSALAFVKDCYLAQISKSTQYSDRMFSTENLLINGLILTPENNWQQLGWKQLDRESVVLHEIEFPCWFSNVSIGHGRTALICCRGEHEYQTKNLDRDELERSYGRCYLTRRSPGNLSVCVESGLNLTSRYRKTDLRYHPQRDQILTYVLADISTPYINVFPESDERIAYYSASIRITSNETKAESQERA